jgi:hypothetical protein
MTEHQDWLPRNHEALFDQANQTFNYLLLPANRDRMGFASTTPQGQWLNAQLPNRVAYTAAYNNWFDPSERTPNKTIKLTEAEEAFKPMYRELYTGFLKNNPLVTDEDLNSMGLPQRSTGGRHPAPIATTVPWTKAITALLRHVSFDYGGSETSKAKPAGQHGMELIWEIAPEKPHSIHGLTHSAFDTHTPITLEFEEEERGKTLWYAVRWENTRGEKGPWSEIMSVVIP